MCPLQTGQTLLASRSARLVGTLHLLCVFCAILHCACCGNVDHHHSHHHQHQLGSNSTTVHPHHPHSQQVSPSLSPSSTSKSVLKSGTVIDGTKKQQQQKGFNDSEERRLHRFNQRFPSMRQCQLPSSGCECLWSAKHLRGMLQEKENSAQSNQHNHALSDHNGGNGASMTEAEEDAALFHRQMAVIMVANVLQMGKLGALGENNWFKCSVKASICEQQKQFSSFSLNRVQLLSTLMPNMANGDQPKKQNSSSEDHHHHHQREELLSSIELFTDIESLLRQINHLLAIDQRANDDDDHKKCFDREDLLDDYQQVIAEATSGKSADHHDHHDRHHQKHEAPVTAENLLYIEHLTNIIVNRLASGECIELFETKFLRDIISRYGTAQSIDNQQQLNSNQSATTLGIHQDGFVKLLNDLHIGGLIENNATFNSAERRLDHDDDHEDDEKKEHHNVVHHRHDHSVSPALKQQQFSSANFRGHRSIASVSPTGSHNHIGHQHEHYHANQLQPQPQQTIPQQHQLKKPRSSAACLDYHYYLHRQGAGADKRKPLTATDLRELSPIFIQQILSGACEQLEPGEHIVGVPTTSTSKILRESSMDVDDNLQSLSSSSSPHQYFDATIGEDAWKVYVYSAISVAIISISSICGVLMIPFLKSSYYTHIINLLIGLAFSSMAGDALLHLLPTVLGIHSHSHSSEDHTHLHDSASVDAHPDHHHDDHNPSSINYMGLMIAMMATIYALFLFEIVSNFFASRRAGGGGGGNHGHSHSHSHQQPTYQKSTANTTNEHQSDYHSSADTPTLTKITTTDNGDQQATYSSSSTIASILTNADQELVTHAHHHHPNHHTHQQQQHSEAKLYKSSSAAESQEKEIGGRTVAVPPKENNMPVIFGMTSLALIITIGDSIHNLLDGVAIGIAFSNSIASGISTSIAVLFHELPHEFGDFAVLLSTGLSVRRAAVINFLSALTAFIGLYIGILLGNNEEANRWALTICAGLFLYVALVDMLPELKEMPSTESGSSTWVISLLVKNVGILTGAGFMILLAKYEDLFKFA